MTMQFSYYTRKQGKPSRIQSDNTLLVIITQENSFHQGKVSQAGHKSDNTIIVISCVCVGLIKARLARYDSKVTIQY